MLDDKQLTEMREADSERQGRWLNRGEADRHDLLKHVDGLVLKLPCWIKVEDRLPAETDQRGLPPHVLVFAVDKQGTTWVDSASYLPRYGGFKHYHGTVTHWMPLPEAPKP